LALSSWVPATLPVGHHDGARRVSLDGDAVTAITRVGARTRHEAESEDSEDDFEESVHVELL